MENPFEIIFEKLNRIENILHEIQNNNFFFSEENKLQNSVLNMEQAAEFISVSKATLYKHTAERKIPHFKAGKKIYFRTSELVDWLTKNRVMTKEEIEQEAMNYILKSRKNKR